MRTLYHHPLCAFSRKVRVVLAEKKLDFAAELERFWEHRPDFVALNAAGEVPVLVEEGGAAVADSTAIVEYLEEVHGDPPLLPVEVHARAEVRRLVGWFDGKFYREVTAKLVGEKVFKRLSAGHGEPDSRLIRAGYTAVHQHLDYIGWLTERRTWLAGAQYTLADIAAAAQISCIDYVGDVPWDKHHAAKDWYARVKSRPAFRTLLADHLPGLPPPRHYADLDF
jgi:glutathione S-transferase